MDVTESTAAKTAIQKAAATLAERDIPLMVKQVEQGAGGARGAAKAKPASD